MAVDGLEKVKVVIKEVTENMEKAVTHLVHEFERIKAGRATQHTLEPVKVDSYGSLVPLNQVANVSIPEPRLIVITPWDKSQVKAIEKGIINANLGFNPSSDGNVVRVAIPILTEERRKDLAKQVKTEGENAKVSVRSARHDAVNELNRLAKDEGVSEDRRDNEKISVQDLTDSYNKKIEDLIKVKEDEIMTV